MKRATIRYISAISLSLITMGLYFPLFPSLFKRGSEKAILTERKKIVISSLLRIDNVAKLIRHGGIGEVV